jgi:cell wall-associated NlpC family hydrolase
MRSVRASLPPPRASARALALLALLALWVCCTGCSATERRTALEPSREASLGDRPVRGWGAGDAATVIDFAWAQIGKRYCWGGTGPSCFDCSGLVQRAWGAAGVRLPRTADAIASELPEVPLDEVRAGDILWWPGHVGLYAGDGWVVEALDRRHGVVRRPAMRPRRAFRPSG